MMKEINWVLGPLAFAIAFALIAPVFAAPAAKAVALTSTSLRTHSRIDDGEAAADPDSAIATHAPARLSPLAGNDNIAWQSANSIHVQKVRRIKFKPL
jgi:hypothetical protein